MTTTLFDDCARAGRAHAGTMLYLFIDRMRAAIDRQPDLQSDVLRMLDKPGAPIVVEIVVRDHATDVAYSVTVQRLSPTVLPFHARGRDTMPSECTPGDAA